MNEHQKQCFDRVYKFIHDEYLNCCNLAGVIDIAFADEQGQLGLLMRDSIAPYLRVRADMGQQTMDLMGGDKGPGRLDVNEMRKISSKLKDRRKMG